MFKYINCCSNPFTISFDYITAKVLSAYVFKVPKMANEIIYMTVHVL